VRKPRYSDEQIAAALRQAEIGTPVVDITRKLGFSEATFYVWKKRFGTLGTPEIRELRQLRDENAKLKAVVADLTLDRAVLQDVIKKSGRPRSSQNRAASHPENLAIERPARVRDIKRQSSRRAVSISAWKRRRCVAGSHQGDRRGSHSLRTTPHSRLAQTRRMAGQYQACCSPLSRRRACNSHKNTAPSTCRRSACNADPSDSDESELGDGLHA